MVSGRCGILICILIDIHSRLLFCEVERLGFYLFIIKHLSTRNLTFLALLFHAVGFGLLLVNRREWFDLSTPLHLLLMTLLLFVAFRKQWKGYVVWMQIVNILGFVAEYIGVHTGLLFGQYQYGKTLGPAIHNIPLLIGLNWVAVLAGSISIVTGLLSSTSIRCKNLWVIILSALLATSYDWLMEPVAVKLGWWTWAGGVIPFYNYVCWFALSMIITFLWQQFRQRPNHFAVNLFLVQLVFFAILRLWL